VAPVTFHAIFIGVPGQTFLGLTEKLVIVTGLLPLVARMLMTPNIKRGKRRRILSR
jgi:hypothetical protein